MQNQRKIGQEQEERMVLELKKQGYQILARNFRCRIGEIDVIAIHQGHLVFVEVKYRKTKSAGYAAEAVTWKKQQTICRVADYYIQKYYSIVPPCRFDVAAIDGNDIKIYQNAFDYMGKN